MKSYILMLNRIGILSILLLAGSCDFLVEDPLTQIDVEDFYKNEQDALGALNGAYAALKSDNGYYRQVWLSNLHGASDQGNSSWQHGDFRRGTISDTDPNLPSSWTSIYAAIRDANNVIARVPDIENIDETLKSRIIGEARFLRGLHYFNLVRSFGQVPLRTEPIKVGDSQGLPVSDIVTIYEQVIADLQYAANNCWGKEETHNGFTNDLGRATRGAAHALLAKAYLHIASAKRTAGEGRSGNRRYLAFSGNPTFYYQLAKNHADTVINSAGYQLSASFEEWQTIFDAGNGNNSEMIFDIQGSSITEQGTALSNLFTPRQAGLSGGGWGGTNRVWGTFINNLVDKFDPRFANTIIREYQDETRSYIINPQITGYIRTELSTGSNVGTLFNVFTGKYIDRNATTEYTSEQNYHVVRLADVYLMRAEAMAEITSNPVLAEADINSLRSRVNMAPFSASGLTMDEFRHAILRERAAELYMEGHRFFDLTRMGLYNDYCVITYGIADGIRGPEDYTWPIPLVESSANDKIN